MCYAAAGDGRGLWAGGPRQRLQGAETHIAIAPCLPIEPHPAASGHNHIAPSNKSTSDTLAWQLMVVATREVLNLSLDHFLRQVCDQPHPLLVAKIIQNCLASDLQPAYVGMKVHGPEP